MRDELSVRRITMRRAISRLPKSLRGLGSARLGWLSDLAWRHRTPQHVRLAGGGALVAAVLVSAALFPAAAGAATRGFRVYNASSFPLVLNGIVSGDFSG